MSIGDRVKVGMGTIDTAVESVAIYNLASTSDGQIIFDHMGGASPKVAGGVKGGSTGTVIGNPVKVPKAFLVGMSNGAAAMGLEYVLVFPVEFDYYKQVAWVPLDHMHIIG